MPSDREWIERAVDQARLSQGEPGRIAPKVGAVVVNKDGEFLAEAHRGEDPCHKDHAEFYALERILGIEDRSPTAPYSQRWSHASRGAKIRLRALGVWLNGRLTESSSECSIPTPASMKA